MLPARRTSGRTVPAAFFGGPDRAGRALRDLLETQVDEVPAGGSIDWMTYYFRDERLASSLVRARRRGVAVRLCLEGAPRRRHANDAVIAMLRDPEGGLGPGLKVVRLPFPAHLHSKVYCFSYPRPRALVGSFNPSGAEAEDDDLLADIGDHDRGHNVLVEVDDPAVVAALIRRVAVLHDGSRPHLLGSPSDARISGAHCEGVLFPFLGRNPLDERLEALPPGASLRIAASHLRDPIFAARLGQLARRGVEVSLITHHTTRRTPPAVERQLLRDGVGVFRYDHPEHLPMHCKFVLADGPRPWSAFGSYNFTWTSRWLNQELLLVSEDRRLWAALDARWRDLMSERWTRCCAAPSAPQPLACA
jgi:phosphatidylserine/phosphatidylglycerophosphate/cardiolipin synthase-like enzyme